MSARPTTKNSQHKTFFLYIEISQGKRIIIQDIRLSCLCRDINEALTYFTEILDGIYELPECSLWVDDEIASCNTLENSTSLIAHSVSGSARSEYRIYEVKNSRHKQDKYRLYGSFRKKHSSNSPSQILDFGVSPGVNFEHAFNLIKRTSASPYSKYLNTIDIGPSDEGCTSFARYISPRISNLGEMNLVLVRCC